MIIANSKNVIPPPSPLKTEERYLRYKKYCDYGVTELMLLPGTTNLKVT